MYTAYDGVRLDPPDMEKAMRAVAAAGGLTIVHSEDFPTMSAAALPAGIDGGQGGEDCPTQDTTDFSWNVIFLLQLAPNGGVPEARRDAPDVPPPLSSHRGRGCLQPRHRRYGAPHPWCPHAHCTRQYGRGPPSRVRTISIRCPSFP